MSEDLRQRETISSIVPSTVTNSQVLDTNAPYVLKRFYRAVNVASVNVNQQFGGPSSYLPFTGSHSRSGSKIHRRLVRRGWHYRAGISAR
jgi:hypothetical protein